MTGLVFGSRNLVRLPTSSNLKIYFSMIFIVHSKNTDTVFHLCGCCGGDRLMIFLISYRRGDLPSQHSDGRAPLVLFLVDNPISNMVRLIPLIFAVPTRVRFVIPLSNVRPSYNALLLLCRAVVQGPNASEGLLSNIGT
jgi:hypothetical protein